MRILVTGGAGYIGSVLCETLLHCGHDVLAFDNLMYEQNLFHLCGWSRFNFIRADVRDESALFELVDWADFVIPLAAIVGMPACHMNPSEAWGVNFEAIKTLDNMRGEKPVIFPTTNSGYGTQVGDVRCTEVTPQKPISIYAQTKCDAEGLLLDSGNVITLRLATVFGMSSRMRLDLLVNDFVYRAVTDGFINIFEKDFKRNYIHVHDVADCFVHCIDNFEDMKNKAYNCGLDTANLSKEELAYKIQEYIPSFEVNFSETGKDPDKRNYVVSNQRLKDAGFEAKRTLDMGIQELIKGYRMLGRPKYKNS